MKTFSGFQSGKVGSVRLPEPVFTELLPLIDDLAELKVTLHVLYRLSQQRGRVPHLRHQDLWDDEMLLDEVGERRGEVLKTALERAVERGTLLRAEAGDETVYFANSPRGRSALEAVRRGEPLPEIVGPARPNVFVLYEQNIGLLTPLIVDELKEAESLYPAEWIEEAFREAVSLNKRSWRYIRAILERWRVEGKVDEGDRRDREGDRRRYIEGKYAEYIDY